MQAHPPWDSQHQGDSCIQGTFGSFQDAYSFKYILMEATKKPKNGGNVSKDKASKPKDEEYVEALRDLKISWMPK